MEFGWRVDVLQVQWGMFVSTACLHCWTTRQPARESGHEDNLKSPLQAAPLICMQFGRLTGDWLEANMPNVECL